MGYLYVGFGQSFFELFYIIELLTRACNASKRLLRCVVDAAAADIVCFGCCLNAIGRHCSKRERIFDSQLICFKALKM